MSNMVNIRPLKSFILSCSQYFNFLTARTRYATVGRFRSPPTQPIFCVGNFKTGTVSLAHLLGPHLRTAHEPDAYAFSRILLARYRGNLSAEEFGLFLVRRVRALGLDCEASGFLPFVARDLQRLFPDSRFILTLRDPVAWAESLLKHILEVRERFGYHYWEPIFDYWFGGDDRHSFEPQERLLEELHLFPLRHVFAHWYLSNRAVLTGIDRKRLLVLPIEELQDSLHPLEDFLELDRGMLKAERAHAHRSSSELKILDRLDAGWVEECRINAQRLVSNGSKSSV